MDTELMPTELLKDGWLNQHRAYPDSWWVKRYWESLEGSHRDAIIHALETVGEFQSLLEVGCNTGPNLRRVHARWPRAELYGMDIHPGAIKYGQLQAKEEGWRWVGYQGDLRDLHLLGENIADVVLSCYSLTYLDPRDIDGVLKSMLTAARRAVILCEPMGPGDEKYLPPGPGVVSEYHYDYQVRVAGLYGGLEGVPETTLGQVSPPHGRLKHILTIIKPPPQTSRP